MRRGSSAEQASVAPTAIAPAPAVSEPRRSRWLNVANVGVSQLDAAVVMLGSLAITPAILHGLGDEAYGGWLLVNSFIGYVRLLDLGTSVGTIKYGAGAHARGDMRDLARVLDTSAALFAGIGALAMLVTICLASALPWLYPTILGDQGLTILVLGAAVAVDLSLRPFAATLRMRSLYFVCDAIEIGTYAVFKLGLVLYFAHERTLSYRVLALITLSEALVRMALIASSALALWPTARRWNPFRADRETFKKLSGIGALFSIIQVADLVRFQLDAAVIGYFLAATPESISIFGVGTRLPSVAHAAIGVVGAVLAPRFSGLSERGEGRELTRLMRKASLATGLLAALAVVNLAVLGPQFLALWLHKPWVNTSGRILLLMLPAYYVSLLTGPSSAALVGSGRLRGLTTLTVAEAAANLLLSVLLVRPLGIFGVALGTAIPLTLFRGVAFPLLLRKELGLAPWAYLRMHAPATVLGLVYLLLVSGLSFIPVTSYSRLVLLGLGSVAVFALLVVGALPEARAELLRLTRDRGRQSEKRTRPFWSAR